MMTENLPASPEVILQNMRDSVGETVKDNVWDVEPMFGLVCDTPKGVMFAHLPIPEAVSRTMTPPQALTFIAAQMSMTGMAPPAHPHEGWNTRGFIFMAEGWAIDSKEMPDPADKRPFQDREGAVESRMCNAALSTGELLSVMWYRGDDEPKFCGIVTPDSDVQQLDGTIILALAKMAAVMA
jgi:hypothetical protein